MPSAIRYVRFAPAKTVTLDSVRIKFSFRVLLVEFLPLKMQGIFTLGFGPVARSHRNLPYGWGAKGGLRLLSLLGNCLGGRLGSLLGNRLCNLGLYCLLYGWLSGLLGGLLATKDLVQNRHIHTPY